MSKPASWEKVSFPPMGELPADNVIHIRGPRHIGDIANEIVERARQKMLENRRRGE